MSENGQGAQLVKFAELLLKKGMPEEAVHHLKEALAKDPGCVQAHYTLAAILASEEKYQKAEHCFRSALRLDPGFFKAHNGLGVVLQQQGLPDEAMAHYREAVRIHPYYQDALVNLAMLLKNAGRLSEAEQLLGEALILQPEAPRLLYNLANILQGTGRSAEAVAAYRKSLVHEPGQLGAHQNLLFALHYAPVFTRQEIFAEHLAFAARHAEPLRPKVDAAPRPRRPGRIRVGYLSPDFREHSVAHFIEPVLRHHDRERFEIFCYSNVSYPDQVTGRLKALCEQWRGVYGLGDEQAAQLISRDDLDILVDLAGHTSGSRPLIMARKPARVQVGWIGYPDTSGMEAVEYRITDPLADPPGDAERFHTERLIRLPRVFSCYAPPQPYPEVSELPFLRNGHITFGSFNNLAKVNPEVIALWAKLLQALPDSRLLLKCRPLADNQVAGRIRAAFASHGVAPQRLLLEGGNPSIYQHLAQYHRIDIALDSFPYNGTTTSCEALWMGVPVITLAGASHCGRTGVTILGSCGLSELVAENSADYLGIASRLACDVPRLMELRRGTREMMQDSPLMDVVGVTREAEEAFVEMLHEALSERQLAAGG